MAGWNGHYRALGECSQSLCCCVTNLQLSQSGRFITGDATLAGLCGGASSQNFLITLSSPDSFSWTAAIASDSLHVSLSSDDQTIAAQDLTHPECSEDYTHTGATGSASSLGISFLAVVVSTMAVFLSRQQICSLICQKNQCEHRMENKISEMGFRE